MANGAGQCPNDAHWLRFEGIEFKDGFDEEGRPITLKWYRWDACDFCLTWYVSRDTGETVLVTKQEPPKSAFRTEREDKQ